jgi:hypothetical protein
VTAERVPRSLIALLVGLAIGFAFGFLVGWAVVAERIGAT